MKQLSLMVLKSVHVKSQFLRLESPGFSSGALEQILPNDLTVLPSPGIMVNVYGNHPQMA